MPDRRGSEDRSGSTQFDSGFEPGLPSSRSKLSVLVVVWGQCEIMLGGWMQVLDASFNPISAIPFGEIESLVGFIQKRLHTGGVAGVSRSSAHTDCGSPY